MESLDCEQRILGGAWQAIAGCLTSEPVWGLFSVVFVRLGCASRRKIQSQIHQNLARKSGRPPSPEVTLGTINATAAVTWQGAHLSHRSHRLICIVICRLGSVQRSVLQKSETNTQVTQQSCRSVLANASSLLGRKAASTSACIIAQKS